MLYECHHGVHDRNDLILRWFNDSFFDLDVWESRQGRIDRFLLCYNKPIDEHAISWNCRTGYLHHRVDDGEGRPGKHKSAPLLLSNGHVDVEPLAARFLTESQEMDQIIASFVYAKILDFTPRVPARVPQIQF